MADQLSPAAQAVWDAYESAECDPYEVDPRRAELAAALRAAADQMHYAGAAEAGDWLTDIAAELDPQ